MPGELIGETCAPNTFILPVNTTNPPSIAGQIYISGDTIIWFDGTSVQHLSGSNTGN